LTIVVIYFYLGLLYVKVIMFIIPLVSLCC